MSDGPFFTRARKDSTFHRGKGNHVEWNHMWDEKRGGKDWCEVRKIFWAERRGGEQRERWWIEHEKIMRNEILFNKMSSLRQWSGEHCCHFTEIVTIDEFHLQRHQFLGCSISWIFCSDRGRLWKPGIESRPSVSPNEAALALRWRLNRKRARMYLWMKTACYEHFLLVLIFRVKRKTMPLWVCCLASYMPAVKPKHS